MGSSTKGHAYDVKIYHFNHHTSTRGLGLAMNDPFNRLWMSYFIRTPWFGAESIGRLYAQFRQIRNRANESVLLASAVVADKARAFFFEPKKAKAMKKSAGKKVFFIITGDFFTQGFAGKKFPYKRLTDAGFSKDKDFLNGWNFLSSQSGMPFNSYLLISVL